LGVKLLLPKQVQIQTIDFCNRKCAWCPNSKIDKQPTTLMAQSVFDKILADLKAVNYDGIFHLYLMAEPLCDHRIEALIMQTRAEFPENIIRISTNGDLLQSIEDIYRLLDAGLTDIGISHYDSTNQNLYEHAPDYRIVHTRLNDLRQSFYNRAGLVNVKVITPLPKCDWLWSKAYINYRGDVVLCCSDYYYQVIFGNVVDLDFATIFNCDLYQQYREAHASGRGKSMKLCRDCDRIKC
jgi:MoaA/NifB/PqqE/SkfB family radical SAM enzyme